jgi:DNA-binding Xre family transcriptional regulator
VCHPSDIYYRLFTKKSKAVSTRFGTFLCIFLKKNAILFCAEVRMHIVVFGDLDIREFAARLKAVRLARGLRQWQVAQRADLNPATYNEIERGKATGLRATTLYRLCQVLDVSADDLLDLSDTPARPPAEAAP